MASKDGSKGLEHSVNISEAVLQKPTNEGKLL